MLNGRKNADLSKDYVHKVKHNGRTVILRTDKKLSDKEVSKLVAKAEKSRLKADKALRDSGLDRMDMDASMREAERELAAAEKEMKLQLQEARQEWNEAKREARQEWKEAKQEAREAEREASEARREALAEAREARQEAWDAKRDAQQEVAPVARISSIFYTKGSRRSSATSRKVSGPDCVAMNKQIAMGGQNGLATQAWAVVAGCGGFEVKIDKAEILATALKGLKKERAKAEKCDDSDLDRAKKIREIDRSIAKVKAQMTMI